MKKQSDAGFDSLRETMLHNKLDPPSRLLFLTYFMLLLVAAPVVAQERPYALADRVDAKVQTEIQRQEIVGLAVVVIDEGKIAWTKGYGFAERETQVPADPADTQFRSASMCKPVTTASAL